MGKRRERGGHVGPNNRVGTSTGRQGLLGGGREGIGALLSTDRSEGRSILYREKGQGVAPVAGNVVAVENATRK